MIERMVRIWRWVGIHRLLAGWAIALVCAVVFGGGVTLGAAREGREVPVPPAERAAPAPKAAGASVVEAIVMGRRGETLIARTCTGDLLYVRTDERTRYRRKNQDADATAVRRGSIVTIVGRPVGDNVIVAKAIRVRGQFRPPQRPPEALGLP